MKFYIVGHTEANHAIYSGLGMFGSQYTPHDAQNNINKLDHFFVFINREEAANYARSLRVQKGAKIETEHNRRAAPLITCEFLENSEYFLNETNKQITKEILVQKYKNRFINFPDGEQLVSINYFDISINDMPAFKILNVCFPDMQGDADMNQDMIIEEKEICSVM